MVVIAIIAILAGILMPAQAAGIIPNHQGRSAALWEDSHIDFNQAVDYKIRTNAVNLNSNHSVCISQDDPLPTLIKNLLAAFVTN